MGADSFTRDETFRSLVTEMLHVKAAACSKFRLWLEDPSQAIMLLQKVSLRDAHRQLLSFFHKRMAHEDVSARMLTAMEICKLRGLLDAFAQEEDVEARLSYAAAEGVGSDDLLLLIEAHGLKHASGSDNKRDMVLSKALIKSAEFGHSHCIEVLIQAKAGVGFRNEDGATPLFAAARNGHTEAVSTLLQANADINAANKNGATPLFIAAHKGHIEAANILQLAHASMKA